MSAVLRADEPRFSIAGVEPGVTLLVLVIALTALRLVCAAYLPLSFDEAYFWLWSKHLAIGYFEHPPLIALAIRAGTGLFGNTSLGVRLMSVAASVLASWATWRAAALLLEDRISAWTACVFLNVTLMMASQGMGATPDALVLAASAALLFCLAQLDRTKNGRWWLLAGLTLGFAFLAKYTAFFLALSTCLWLVLWPEGRRWLKSPWPYLAAVLAFAFLVPNLVWNDAHGWMSFRYQFGRVVAGGVTPQHLLEFLAGQLALASPFILVLSAIGLLRETRAGLDSRLSVVLALVWPAIAYFCLHSLHDRVQGNWPSFIYPGLAILAASAVRPVQHRTRIITWLGRLALPMAVLILAASYLQTWTGLLPLGKSDPIARMTAVGFEPVAKDISAFARTEGVAALVTTRYVNTGWLAFYVRPHLPVLQAAEQYRWSDAPAAGPQLLNRPLLYVTQHPERELHVLSGYFSQIDFKGCVPRMWSGIRIDSFCLYRLAGFRGQVGLTRIPIAFDPHPSRPQFEQFPPARP